MNNLETLEAHISEVTGKLEELESQARSEAAAGRLDAVKKISQTRAALQNELSILTDARDELQSQLNELERQSQISKLKNDHKNRWDLAEELLAKLTPEVNAAFSKLMKSFASILETIEKAPGTPPRDVLRETACNRLGQLFLKFLTMETRTRNRNDEHTFTGTRSFDPATLEKTLPWSWSELHTRESQRLDYQLEKLAPEEAEPESLEITGKPAFHREEIDLRVPPKEKPDPNVVVKNRAIEPVRIDPLAAGTVQICDLDEDRKIAPHMGEAE